MMKGLLYERADFPLDISLVGISTPTNQVGALADLHRHAKCPLFLFNYDNGGQNYEII